MEMTDMAEGLKDRTEEAGLKDRTEEEGLKEGVEVLTEVVGASIEDAEGSIETVEVTSDHQEKDTGAEEAETEETEAAEITTVVVDSLAKEIHTKGDEMKIPLTIKL